MFFADNDDFATFDMITLMHVIRNKTLPGAAGVLFVYFQLIFAPGSAIDWARLEA